MTAEVSGPDKVAWVHIENRRLLVGRNRGATRFYLPGGGREAGESDMQTLAREVLEELDVTIDINTATHVGTYQARRDGRDDYLVFVTYTAQHHGTVEPKAEVEELAWVTSVEGYLVTDAERQLMETLVARGVLD